jgi:hypothetical protein
MINLKNKKILIMKKKNKNLKQKIDKFSKIMSKNKNFLFLFSSNNIDLNQ